VIGEVYEITRGGGGEPRSLSEGDRKGGGRLCIYQESRDNRPRNTDEPGKLLLILEGGKEIKDTEVVLEKGDISTRKVMENLTQRTKLLGEKLQNLISSMIRRKE